MNVFNDPNYRLAVIVQGPVERIIQFVEDNYFGVVVDPTLHVVDDGVELRLLFPRRHFLASELVPTEEEE